MDRKKTDIVYIPDIHFKNRLLNNHKIDTNKDGEISYGEAIEYKGAINVSRTNDNDSRHKITSLIGIEAFSKITSLSCHYNDITNLDVSKCTELLVLNCKNNKLTFLKTNDFLKTLDCSYNQLTVLDVSRNQLIESVICNDNQLTQFNLHWQHRSSNMNPPYVDATNNPNLTCIQIYEHYNKSWRQDTQNWLKDKQASYKYNCNYPTLSTTEVKAENAIQILNPVKDNLIIKTTAKVERVEIYNTAGQLVKVLFKGNTQVQDLAKGVYLVKITTDKGVITEKIIKQ